MKHFPLVYFSLFYNHLTQYREHSLSKKKKKTGRASQLHEVAVHISAHSPVVSAFIRVPQIFGLPQSQLLASGYLHGSLVNGHDKLRRTRIVSGDQGPISGTPIDFLWWEELDISFICHGHNDPIANSRIPSKTKTWARSYGRRRSHTSGPA